MNTTNALFGDKTQETPAEPGSYGFPPKGYRLPDATHVGEVHLAVADIARSRSYYENVLGFRSVELDGATIALHAGTDTQPLVVLHEQAGIRSATRRGKLGLFHFAILLPNRESLGRFVRHLASIGEQAGAGDHLVSEAFYLSDPDGLGIEVYADRPRSTWMRQGRELMMATDPVDVQSLVRAAGDEPWSGMPAGTVMGHVHLHVGDLDAAGAFYADGIGFDRIVMRYPGALFMSAGGYHHHLGTNTWAGSNAVPATATDARLLEWTIVLPNNDAISEVAASLRAAGADATLEHDGSLFARDPWGTAVRLRTGA
jgi:catechol 2,3-dioxygenase